MDQISEHNNSSNHKIYSCDQMGEIVVNLGNRKFENNNDSKYHINHIQKSLLFSIVDTPENNVSNIDRKLY